MIYNLLKKVLSNNKQKVSENLDHLKIDERIKIATSTIIIEAVTADNNLSIDELSGITELFNKKFGLNYNQSKKLIELSKKYRSDHPDIWHFTNIINEHLDKEAKYELIEMVWRAIYADGNLDKYESSLSHKLRGLLHIEHSKFIEIKLKVQNDINK